MKNWNRPFWQGFIEGLALAPLWSRLVSERYLLDHGLWCECSGDPMNAWAEEYDRRDAEKGA